MTKVQKIPAKIIDLRWRIESLDDGLKPLEALLRRQLARAASQGPGAKYAAADAQAIIGALEAVLEFRDEMADAYTNLTDAYLYEVERGPTWDNLFSEAYALAKSLNIHLTQKSAEYAKRRLATV